MDDVAEGVLAFLRWTLDNPLPPDVSTLAVLSDLRGRMDARTPGWRERALGEPTEGDAIAVEFHLLGGRVVRGTLVQRPSGVRGEAV
ncbi:unnamed protein product [Gemmataceae bacterium]|nr:unnamed protein product [Gemmataceae bacterium]VTT98990.1 unnamed protein product [Gemmataceae bacterium]